MDSAKKKQLCFYEGPGAYDNLFVGQSSTDLQDSNNEELMNQIWTNTSL